MDSKPIIYFIFQTVIAKVDLASARDKSLAVEKLLPLLFEMKDPLRQAHYVERLAKLLKIDEHILGDALKKLGADERTRKATKNMEASTPVVHAITSSSHWDQYCLALLLQFPE